MKRNSTKHCLFSTLRRLKFSTRKNAVRISHTGLLLVVLLIAGPIAGLSRTGKTFIINTCGDKESIIARNLGNEIVIAGKTAEIAYVDRTNPDSSSRDNEPSEDAQVNITIEDQPASIEALPGRISREVWTDIPGRDISTIPLDSQPSSVSHLILFETPENIGDNYGTRLRGYLVAPQTGNYTFWISSDDLGEVWISTDENPLNKKKIAQVQGWTNSREWNKYPGQRSAPVSLVSGRKYYVEALMKEGYGRDHVAVGWQLPDGSFERPIPGIRVIPFEAPRIPPPCTEKGFIQQEFWVNVPGRRVSDIPFDREPDFYQDLTFFEGASNIGDNYASRIRGYVCPPLTGAYTFWIAGDDNAELWLGSDDNPGTKARIAYHRGWTSSGRWTKYPTQQSSPVMLIANHRYYIEAVMKEATGEDHVSVGWQLPDGALERPIAGTHLMPLFPASSTKIMNLKATPDATSVILSWTPVKGAWRYEVRQFGPGDDVERQSTLGKNGYFTAIGLSPNTRFSFVVEAVSLLGSILARSDTLSVTTTGQTSIRTHYNLLAIVFNPDDVMTPYMEGIRTFLKYRIDFLKHASHYSVNLDLYNGDLIIINAYPPLNAGTTGVDYKELVITRYPELNNNSMVDLIESYDIDIVWQLGGPPGYDFGENALIGFDPLGKQTWIPHFVACSRNFFVHSNSADARAFDAAAHHVEGTMTSATEKSPETWPRDKIYQVYTKDRHSRAVYQQGLNLFERFRLTDEWTGVGAYASKGNANCGSSHFVPGSIRNSVNYPDYTYYDPAAWQRYVDCYADDWLSYPNFSEKSRKINGYDFGAFNYYQQGTTIGPFAFGTASFHYWWFNHIPHNPGVTDQKLNNWWPYIYDVNRFDGSAIDYPVDGFPEIPKTYNTPDNEFGTDESQTFSWQFWHSNTNYGLRADLTSIAAAQEPDNVKTGQFSLKAILDVREFATDGRNDLIYPTFKNAHWNFLNADSITFSIKFQGRDDALRYTYNTNPVFRLCQNGNNRIEFVPQIKGVYANLFRSEAWLDDDQWFTFSIPISGNESWKRNVIGYIEPGMTPEQNEAAASELIQKILADVNYFEVSMLVNAPKSTDVTFYLDNVRVHFQDTEKYAALPDKEVSVSLFPVPTLDELHVNITGAGEQQVRIVIRDYQGEPVYRSEKSVEAWNEAPVNMSNLPPGLYFAHFSGSAGNEIRVMKILKK